jgi:hypothetical protein
LIAPDDAENIENIEKLIGLKIDRYAVPEGEEAEESAKPVRRGRGKAPAKREDAERPARAPREERAPREARAPREERPARESRPSREDRAPRPERGRRQRDDDGPDEGWNGPVPDFLSAVIGG